MQKRKRGTPARRKRKPESRALVARKAPRFGLTVLEDGTRVPSLSPLAADPLMPATFVGTLTLSVDQIAVLRRPVDDAELEWRAAVQNGPPVIPYLSHNGYRDRLDAAFGLGGWGMVPVGAPKQEGTDFIYVPYALVIGGVPRVYTWGEQQKFKMTYGDALEGCKSNAITRCGKELGIARELWDKRHVETLLKRKGTVAADGKTRASEPRSGYNAAENEPITQGQRQRLAMIVKHSGRTEFEVRQFLDEMFGLKGANPSKAIKRGDYDAICTAIERPGELPRPPAPTREPGED